MRVDALPFKALPSLHDAPRAVMARTFNCATLACLVPERALWQ